MGLSKKYNLWNKNFIAIFLINFVICFVFYISTVVSMSFAKDVLNASTMIAGFANGIFVIGALVSRLYFGSIIDNINIKKTILISLILYLIPNFYYMFLHTSIELMIVRFFGGVCYGICSCGCGAAIARLVPSNKRGVGIGYYAVSVVLSSAVGPYLGVTLASSKSYNLSFIISLITIAIALVASFILKVRKYKKARVQKAKSGFSIYNYVEKSIISLACVVFCLGFVYGAILAFITSYSKELNLIQAGSVFFIIYAAVSVFSRPVAGKIFDKLGANFIIIPSLIMYIASMAILATASNSYMIFASAILCALGYGNASSSLQSLAIKTCPPSKMGLANSTFFIALDVGMGLSPYLLGAIEPYTTHSSIYMTCAGVILFALLVYYFVVTRKVRSVHAI